jgi:hypothetical protein
MKIKMYTVKFAWILWLLAALVAIAFFSIKIHNWGPVLDAPEQSDFEVYYYSGVISKIKPEFLYHHLKWSEASGGEFRYRLPFLYIPAYAVLMRPLSELPYHTAKQVWFWCSIIAIVVTVYILYRYIPSKKVLTLSVIFWLLNPAALDTLFLGQVNAFLALLLTLACVGLGNPKYAVQLLAGMCLGFASAIKPFPIGLALFAFSRKHYSYVAGTVVSLILLFVIGFAALPLKVTQDYFNVMLGVATEFAPPGVAIFWNQSIAAFWSKLNMPIDVMIGTSPPPNPMWVTVLSVVSSFGFAGLTIKALLQKKDREGREISIYEICLVLIAMLLLTPNTWWHYLLITTFIFIAIAKILLNHSTTWWQRIALPLGYLLIVTQRGMERILPRVRINILSSLMFFGLMIWWYVVMVISKENWET